MNRSVLLHLLQVHQMFIDLDSGASDIVDLVAHVLRNHCGVLDESR